MLPLSEWYEMKEDGRGKVGMEGGRKGVEMKWVMSGKKGERGNMEDQKGKDKEMDRGLGLNKETEGEQMKDPSWFCGFGLNVKVAACSPVFNLV